jgi:uncharacterized protein
MPERFLIVDGHSIIFAWPELRSLHAHRTLTAREELIKILTQFQDYSGTRVVLVFDGTGVAVNETSEPGGIQIFYSSTSKTADDIVERLVAKYSQIYPITIATADLMEQQTAISFGADCVGAEGLRQMIKDAKIGFDIELKRRGTKKRET